MLIEALNEVLNKRPKDDYITKVKDLSSQKDILDFIEELDADGGDDDAEAVLDGLNDAISSTSWTPLSQKFIFHIADAPPHGKIYTEGYDIGDSFPEGCGDLKIEDIAAKINAKGVQYHLLKVGELGNMPAIFKSHIERYGESDLDDANEVFD